MLSLRTVLLSAVSLLALTTGCKPTLIPNSDVESTPRNRELADVMENYRKALESKDVNAVLALVSTEYFEDNGTSDPSDDYNFEGLRQHLTEDLQRVQALRVSIRMRRVEVDGDRAQVDYRFQTRALVSFPSQEQWITKTDDNRISLRREGGRWRIVAGL
ncbi:MAG: nuclear transport factor 2 family protein [Myxococcota bacterium]